MILQDQGHIDEGALPLRISEFRRESLGPSGDSLLSIPPEGIDLNQVEKELIRQALIRSRGNQTQASHLLSITRDTLRYKMKKYGIDKEGKSLSSAVGS